MRILQSLSTLLVARFNAGIDKLCKRSTARKMSNNCSEHACQGLTVKRQRQQWFDSCHITAAVSVVHLFLLFDCIVTPKFVNLQDAGGDISELYGLRYHSQHQTYLALRGTRHAECLGRTVKPKVDQAGQSMQDCIDDAVLTLLKSAATLTAQTAF